MGVPSLSKGKNHQAQSWFTLQRQASVGMLLEVCPPSSNSKLKGDNLRVKCAGDRQDRVMAEASADELWRSGRVFTHSREERGCCPRLRAQGAGSEDRTGQALARGSRCPRGVSPVSPCCTVKQETYAQGAVCFPMLSGWRAFFGLMTRRSLKRPVRPLLCPHSYEQCGTV